MIELTQNEKLYLLDKEKIRYTVVQDGNITKDKNGYVRPEPTKFFGRCWCSANGGKKLDGAELCPCCGSDQLRYHKVASKPFRAALMEEWNKSDKYARWTKPDIDEKETLRTFFYVRNNPDKDGAIQILKISISLKGGNTRQDDETLVWKIHHTIDVVPGESCRAYKTVRGKEVDIDMFDAFQLSSSLMKNSPNIQFDKASGMIDFVLKNKKFNQYSGFMQCYNLAEVVIPRNSFFMFYMYLYARYPVVEFVVKMGYIDLVAKIMRDLANGYNKENIRERAMSLTKIINCEATNGSMALTVPRYIADDLNRKEANLEEYVMWGDICQMSDSGPISKENYLKATRNFIYPRLRYHQKDIPNILKYGYEVSDIVKYLTKQVELVETAAYVNRPEYLFGLWRDYLNMCDMMLVEHEKFPMNIKSAHDNVMTAFNAKKNEMSDKAINYIAIVAEKHIPKNSHYEDSEYVIVLPHSVNDVVQEGQAQHNCVGSYVNKIVNGRSLVFFIRKKDEPQKSFVTAEYAYGRLSQICYKNNQRVTDKTILTVAQDFCDNLKTSVEFRGR